ncbi:hypothetical protein OG21DRAFT_1488036 [Imleria badia]|nr:hypothetical protein OG21DRAFT_1488036 [Imleria badia]
MDCVNPNNVMLRKSGAGSAQYYLCFVNPPNHPGAMHAPMPQYYVLQDQRVIERVPRPPHLSPPCESIPAIIFVANGWAGVPVMDLLMETAVISAANDAVLEEQGFRTITISLEWPGYDTKIFGDSMHARIDVRPGGQNITRQHLAREICGLLSHFHKVISKYRITPGWEKWALTAGPGGIRVQDIVLLSLHYYRNVWVPEFYVIE